MQVLRHSGCWGGNSTPIYLLDNNENYAFIGIKWRFFDFLPPDITLEEGLIRTKSQRFLKLMKIEAELYNSTVNELFQTLVFIQIFSKSL